MLVAKCVECGNCFPAGVRVPPNQTRVLECTFCMHTHTYKNAGVLRLKPWYPPRVNQSWSGSGAAGGKERPDYLDD